MNTTPSTFQITANEMTDWEKDGYFVRENVFSEKENDDLRQVAEDIVAGKRMIPIAP